AWIFSTPNGIDESNFFYAICHDESLGFVMHHAPTSSNPYIPKEELEETEKKSDPRVWQQEYLAEFVDWSKDALLDVDKLLVDGQPIEMPPHCDMIFAVMDTALKGGTENDGTGVVYFAYESTYSDEPKLTIIDWDVTQIKASLLPEYIPGVYDNLERLAKLCRPRLGSQGIFMEDAAMGAILNQKAETEGWDMTPIKSALTSKGKDERAVMASSYHYQGMCKIVREAYDKTVSFKRTTANHLIKQIAGFHLADKDAHKRADDLFDCYTYGLIIAHGNYAEL
ncbi:TPA: terminase, partial [Escherichia coli]